MTGLELARRFWDDVGRPAFSSKCPGILECAAVGLAGEGSECFGFDDEISRDHDWGPGFCLWLTDDAMEQFGGEAQRIYADLPSKYMGYSRLHVSEETAGRVGVQSVGAFFARYTGLDRAPRTVREWRTVPEFGLSVVTNGEIWQDPDGSLTEIRQALLGYYPEQLRLKKLAAACALAAQSGQYNYYRCMRRGETVAAFSALAEFITQAQRTVFLLNRRFMPYYKWTHRALCALPILGTDIGGELRALAGTYSGREERIERISAAIIGELRRQGLSSGSGDFLLEHAAEVLSRITDPELSALHIMAE